MTEGDYEAVRSLYEEPGVLDYMPSFFEGDDPKGFFDSYVRHMYRFYDFGMYAVVEKCAEGAPQIIGHVGLGLSQDETGEPVVTLGYVMSRRARGRGIAFRACKEVLSYARDVLELPEVQIHVHPENQTSIALARKLEQAFPSFARLYLAKTV